jgi:hypothetical protein
MKPNRSVGTTAIERLILLIVTSVKMNLIGAAPAGLYPE